MAPYRKRQRIPRELLYIKILQYMFENAFKQGFSKYELMRIPDLTSQRQDRVSEIIDKMIAEKRIEIVFETDNATYYNITEKGRNWFKNIGKDIAGYFISFEK